MAYPNTSDIYYGAYVRFDTPDKRFGGALVGPDNAIGDIGSIEWELDERGHRRGWLVNPYGARIGYLNQDDSHTLALLHAKEWEIHYVLSLVAYSETNAPGGYWGQVAVIAFPPRYAERFEAFLRDFARSTGDGARPDPELSLATIEDLAQDPSSWKPKGNVKPPAGAGRTAIVKDHRTIHDKFLDQYRKKNPGCFIISWIVFLGVIGCAVWLLHSLGWL